MRLKVDIIVVATGDVTIQAAKNATKTIPIVMTGQGSDPVRAGCVESLLVQLLKEIVAIGREWNRIEK